MIKVTALALFIALTNADSAGHGPSRLLLQAPQNPAGVQPQPQQAAPYNPCANILNNPYCRYDYQNCIDMAQDCMQNPFQYGYQYGFPYQYPVYPPVQPQPQPVPPQPQVQPPPVAQPPAPAPVDPVTVVPPAPVDPVAVTPSNPAPAPPVNQAPVNPAPPVNGVPGNTVPNPGFNPGLMPGGIIPGMPGMITQPITEINCGPMPPATLCANRRSGPGGSPLGPLNLGGRGVGLADNFKLYCDTPGACSGSEINIDLLPNPMNPQGVQQINQLLFSEPQSGAGTTVNIKNQQMTGNNVELSNLECSDIGSCNGLTINGWGVSLNDVNCPDVQNCMGCTFKSFKPAPDMFCPDPFGPEAVSNPGCLIEQKPCYGY